MPPSGSPEDGPEGRPQYLAALGLGRLSEEDDPVHKEAGVSGV